MRRKASRSDRAPSPRPSSSSLSSVITSTTLALLGAVLILGIAIGVAFSRTTNFTPENVASIEFIDQSAPNAEFCQAYGASATVMDTRVFVTYKPFSVYVNQPIMKPGCVVRNSNMAILQQRNLVKSEQLRDCRQRLNTFGFTGTLEGKPEISCIYQSNSQKNLFLNQPGAGTPPPEADNF